MKTLILGLGNELYGDDGIGIYIIQRLELCQLGQSFICYQWGITEVEFSKIFQPGDMADARIGNTTTTNVKYFKVAEFGQTSKACVTETMTVPSGQPLEFFQFAYASQSPVS